MSNESEQEFLEKSSNPQPSLISEFVEFFFQNKKWWLTPIIIILLILGLFIVLTNTAAGPFIYVFLLGKNLASTMRSAQ